MTDTRFKFIKITVLILLLAAGHSVLAGPPVKVESADPPEAPQDTPVQPVRIGGSGFLPSDGAVTAVRFTLPGCTEPPDKRDLCPTGDVTVTGYSVTGRKTIDAILDVGEFAVVDFRDIEIEITTNSGGRRGGKGTTLFSVREKGNGNGSTVTCNEVFFDIPRGQPGPCMAVNRVDECELGLGNPERIKNMIMDCSTTETLFLPVTNQLSSLGNIESDDDNYSLTAIAPFTGTSVVANAGHRASVRQVNIVIGNSVTNVGCGPDELNSAVRFVLDETTEPPFTPGDELNEGRATTFGIDHSFVITEGGPLCEAIVFERKAIYTSLYPTTNDWKVGVAENNIAPGSYIKTGIRFQGFKQQQDINPPYVSGNVVGAPACNDPEVAIGIVHGPGIARDFNPQSDAVIEGNTITMANGTCPDTSGIVLLGDSDTQMAGAINNNNISGAFIGVLIDGNAANDDVNLKGNTLAGDTGVSGDVGVCSNLPVGEKGKPNTISGYTDEIIQPPDTCLLLTP